MKYRAEIDGLRALAVLPVILFHAGFEVFSGGFVGVDVFFVISGYLITSILISDLKNNRFSFIDFYERRARRILPALFLVVLLCIPFAWLLMLPSQMLDFSESLVAVVFFASNILFWQESGYFESSAEEKPLLHTWSLAVEEQFYLLFPVFLFLVWRLGSNRVFWAIGFLAGFSLLLSEWGWRNAWVANFYLIPTRAWELLLGSMAAFVVSKKGVRPNNFFALSGLIAIVASIFIYDESTPFPSIYSLVPVLGVVSIVLCADSETLAGRLLKTKVLVGIGLISYSAYLWHQPIFAFARITAPESLALMMGLSIASLGLAYLSWKYVEVVFRNKDIVPKEIIFGCSISGVVLLASIGALGHIYHDEIEGYWLSKKSEGYKRIYNIVVNVKPETSNFGANRDGVQEFTDCRFNVPELTNTVQDRLLSCQAKYGRGVLVFGDSHAIDLFGVLASRFDNEFLVGVTQGGCRAHANYKHCPYKDLKNYLSKNPDTFSVVIYEQAGFYLMKQGDGSPGTREMFGDLGMDEEVIGIVPDAENIASTLAYLEEISEIVKVKWFLPRIEPHISTRYTLNQGCDYNFSLRGNQAQVFKELDAYIETTPEVLSNPNITAINQNKLFGFNFPQDYMNCNTIFWSDVDHFSSDGEEHFGSRLPADFLN